MEAVLKQKVNGENKPSKKGFVSGSLLKQSIKANWMIWLLLTLCVCLMIGIINIVVGKNKVFTEINMEVVGQYIDQEGLDWLTVLGLLQQMGFSLSKIQIMASVDMNSIMTDIIYKIATTLLPMVYVVVVSSKLIAGQVSNGSMAYVLSTPTSRRKVAFTQFLFLIGSLFAMFLSIMLVAMVTELIGYKGNALPVRTLLYCASSFSVLFCMACVCFAASCIFNQNKNSLAVGGGFCILNFLDTILGLFGTKIFVAVGVGVQSMNVFNYLSIITLFDTESIGGFAKFVAGRENGFFTLDWLWKMGILFAIGIGLTIAGIKKFEKKDLPL